MSLLSREDWNSLTSGQSDYRGDVPESPVLFPGSFNPIHDGHRQMVALAARQFGRKIYLEISLANVDKPDVSFDSLCERMEQASGLAPVVLTRSPRFVDKARLFPGATFIIGADTALRLDDPIYYGNQESQRDLAIDAIGQLGCRFHVFGREVGGKFCDATSLPMSRQLGALCDCIPETDFRVDISSTDLR